jgi:methyl-accepting chemotaxis protein
MKMEIDQGTTILAEIVSSVPVATFAIDATAKITHFNKAAEDISGYPITEALGMRLRDVFGNTLGKKGCLVIDALNNGKGIEIESMDVINSENEPISIHMKAKPLFDQSGKIVGGIGFLEPLGTSSEGLTRSLVDHAPNMVISIESDLTISFVNQTALKVLGKEESDVLGKKCYEVFDSGMGEKPDSVLEAVLRTGDTAKGEVAIKIQGVERHYRITAAARKNAAGKVEGVIEYYNDITRELEYTKEVLALTQSAIAGDVKARANADKFEGNDKKIVQGINDTLDAYLAPLKVAAHYVKMISKGEMPGKITATWNGDFNIMKTNLNLCIDAVTRMLTDSKILEKAAAEQKFDVRADVSRHMGDFAKVINGFNVTLDKVVEKTYWYEQILDSIPWPISVTDMEMRITFINKPAMGILKVDRKDLIGKHCTVWNGPICNTKNCGIIRLKDGLHSTISERDGKNSKIDVNYLTNAKGENIGHVEVMQDVTKTIRQQKYQAGEFMRLSGNLKNLSMGSLDLDLNLIVPDDYTKELSQEYQNVNKDLTQVKDAISSMARDVDSLVDAAINGKLTMRADAAKHHGAYNKIVMGVNDTLDAVIGPLNVAAKYVDDISKGTIPAKITNEYKGDFNVIKNNLNQCIDGLGGLVEANASLQKMAMNDFTIKVSNSHKGIYNEVAVAVNAVQERIEHVISTLIRISQGELADLENYKQLGNGAGRRSQNDMLVPSMIKLMENLKALIADADMLSKAAVDGKLKTRADVSKHQGDYQKIVQGVNDTLDAVTEPIQEAMRIAESYAEGDLTARVSIDAKGDFAAFATSLDKIGESMCNLLAEVNNSVNMVSSTSQELASSAEEMNASTEQVSSAIQQISKGAQSQAAQVDETAKAMASVTKTVEEAEKRSVKASEGARATSQRANAGVSTVENTIKKMQEIQKVVVESAKVIESLGKRSEEIGEIVDVITNISDQTNLLALNAAIEAARAGEQGRGFAVVAEEVKNLAEDSREAAERIAKMIKEVQSETGKAVEAMQRGTKETAEGMEHVEVTGKAFREISLMAGQFEELMNTLQLEMRAQKEGANKAARAVDSIASVAEETASASEESAASTEELTASMEDMTARAQALSEMSVNLQKIASQFKIDRDTDEVCQATGPEVAPLYTRKKEIKRSPPKVSRDEVQVPRKVKEALNRRGIEAGK